MSDEESTGPDPAELDTVDGAPVLRLQRFFAHPPEKVWLAVTDPAELAHWFPAALQPVDGEMRAGAALRFVFAPDAPLDQQGTGEVLEYDPPQVFSFRWNVDVLRLELVADGDGCRLLFSHRFGAPEFATLGAGRTAAGWDSCLAALAARLAGRTAQPWTDWLTPMESYAERFGLGAGTVRETPEGYTVHFARDLVWKPLADVWALLTADGEPETGATPPVRATNGYVPAGPVTGFRAPELLEYRWCHRDASAGTVRWVLTADEVAGPRIELTQSIPASLADELPTALAAWHVHMELFFAALFGVERCPWPEARTTELTAHYATELRG